MDDVVDPVSHDSEESVLRRRRDLFNQAAPLGYSNLCVPFSCSDPPVEWRPIVCHADGCYEPIWVCTSTRVHEVLTCVYCKECLDRRLAQNLSAANLSEFLLCRHLLPGFTDSPRKRLQAVYAGFCTNCHGYFQASFGFVPTGLGLCQKYCTPCWSKISQMNEDSELMAELEAVDYFVTHSPWADWPVREIPPNELDALANLRRNSPC